MGAAQSFAGPLSTAEPVAQKRVIVFDFDLTLTTVHVFKSLAGWTDQVAALRGLASGAVARPHAVTEKGQLMRVHELGPAWIEDVFGGPARVAELRDLLGRLRRQPGYRLILLTRGYVAVARKCLSEAGLLEYFERVHGNIGAAYGDGTSFDAKWLDRRLPPELEDHLGSYEEWVSKTQIILDYKQNCAVEKQQIVLVDDDKDEVQHVSFQATIVHVRGPVGLAHADVAELLSWAGLDREDWATRVVQRWRALPDPLSCHPPPIIWFNRLHLPVLPTRHLACLETELSSCPTAIGRVKLLLREPMLLLSVAQREFVQHMRRDDDGTFSTDHLKSVVECMQTGVTGEDVSDVDPADNGGVDPAEWFPIYPPQAVADVDVDGGNTVEQGGAVSEVGNLYRKPKRLCSFSVTSEALENVVSNFKNELLGLCPLTLTKTGKRRNFWGCHDRPDLTDGEYAIYARYQRLGKLGAGAFGAVYKAKENCSGQEVAVKVIERLETTPDGPGGASEENDADEVHTLKALAHPNILRIFEVVRTAEEVFIICEFASGGTLSSYAQKHPDPVWLPGAVHQVAGAVAYCHQMKILHGDLKPENVLIGGALRPDGTPLCLVSDFGQTVICIGHRASVAAPGDPRYIAPEVMGAEGMSEKSDVYMLGVTAFELLSGGFLPFFDQKSVTLECSYYQLNIGGVRDVILSEDGPNWNRLKGSQPEAVEFVRPMLLRHPRLRPSVEKVLGHEWIKSGSLSCKVAYDAMLASDGGALSFGLWAPQRPDFAERLSARADASLTTRLLLGMLSSRLDLSKVWSARLLFRRMDSDSTGTVTQEELLRAARKLGLDECVATRLFKAGDLHEQHFWDYENLATILIDVEGFTKEELLAELRSVLNHLCGPGPGGVTTAGEGPPRMPLSALKLSVASQDKSMQEAVDDLQAKLGCDVQYLTAELLLAFLCPAA